MKTKKRKILSILIGLFTGFINGTFGGGGGMIVVPALINLLGKSQTKAQATAIAVILPVSVVSAIVYSSLGNADISILLPVGAGVIVGGTLGAIFLPKASEKFLFFLFYAVMLFAGVKMAF